MHQTTVAHITKTTMLLAENCLFRMHDEGIEAISIAHVNSKLAEILIFCRTNAQNWCVLFLCNREEKDEDKQQTTTNKLFFRLSC